MSKVWEVACWRVPKNWAMPKGEWGFWFRIFGRGLHITNAAPVFSERYGYTKTIRVFGVKIKYLFR